MMPRLIGLCATCLAALALACGGSEAPERTEASSELASRHTLDPGRVPENLRHLVPLAERWGIGDDVERGESIQRSSPADRDALAAALAPHQAEITAWLDSLDPTAMSEEAAAFMYTQLAREEMR